MSRPTPPDGYATWLDYAVVTMDTRGVATANLFDDDDSKRDRDAMSKAAFEELE